MRVLSPTLCAGVALIAGAMGCARNTEETGTARVQDTTAVADTAQNPPGYRGMERDTAMVPPAQKEPVDTFLEQQGTNPKADTAGYGGLEHPDTTGMQRDTTGQADTTGFQTQPDTAGYQTQPDTSGYQGQTDTSSYQQQGQTGRGDSVRVPHDSTRIHRDSAGVTQPDTGGTEGTEMGPPSDTSR